ncbi:MAG: hypothetical protein PHX30_05795 [Candidatus Pacebacteria bacterium]|jgi:hypothetical protein|nr:hypothetical protein [Candidatus Paceibacterota bacterium]
MQKNARFREQGDSNELNQEVWKKKIEANKRDAERIDHIREYIEQNSNSDEGKMNIDAFWKNFKEIFYEEKDSHRSSKRDRWGDEYRYGSPEMIKGGILGEMAAEKLLQGLNVYFANPENMGPGFEHIDFSQIKISVKKSTVDEDVLEQTDLKLGISYKGLGLSLPVQVKCVFMQDPDSPEARSIMNRPIIFDQHNTREYEPNGKAINRFYKKYGKWGGAFITILRGCDNREINNYGVPSKNICLPFYEAAKWDIYDFLMEKIKQQS